MIDKLLAMGMIVLSCFLSSCRFFEFSLYGIPPVDPEGSLTGDNLLKLSASDKPLNGGEFSFAVISDTHSNYDELADAVQSLNADSSIRFVLVSGDFTQYGLSQEYVWFRGAMLHLSAPYLTVIGNHDALANGGRIYQNLFGAFNYSFKYRGIKFVCFNDIVWQFPPPTPDLGWLENQLTGAGDSLRVFTMAHIAPFPIGDQFDAAGADSLSGLLARHHVALSIYGHGHSYSFGEYYGDGVPYLTVDNIEDRNYVKITVTDTGYSLQRTFF